ncbi:MAG: DMT family transporter [Sphingomonadaceae bacterium]|nr:DMT family transporter [Sphingomonadaceae bacterium]
MAGSLRFVFPLFLIGSAILSAGPLLVRLADVGPVQSAFWRLAIAAPFLIVLARATVRERVRFLPRSGAIWLVLGGFFFAADLATWHFGIERTTLANSTLLGNSTAFLFPIWGYLVLRQWPSRTALTALILAAAGVAALASQSASISPVNFAGDLFCLVAALFYTGYLIVMDRARAGMTALSALASATVAGALFLLPVALLTEGSFWPQNWAPLLILALSSQVAGQGLVIYALPHLPPIASGIGLLVQPLLAALLGFLCFNEILAGQDIVGMAMIFAAILLVRSSGRTSRVEKRTPPSLGGAQPPA